LQHSLKRNGSMNVAPFVFGSEVRQQQNREQRALEMNFFGFSQEKKHPNAPAEIIFIYMPEGYINTQQKCYKYIGFQRKVPLDMYVAFLPFLSKWVNWLYVVY
jgi:hypothetical protein